MDKSLVDLIGPYKIIRQDNDDPIILETLSIIDPGTGWFEIVHYDDKQDATIAS